MTDTTVYDADARPVMASRALDMGQPHCTENRQDGVVTWRCTREEGHNGNHQAGSGSTCLAEWGAR